MSYMQNLHVSIDLPHMRLQMLGLLEEKQQEINDAVKSGLEHGLKNFDFNGFIEEQLDGILKQSITRALESQCRQFFVFGPGKDVFDKILKESLNNFELLKL